MRTSGKLKVQNGKLKTKKTLNFQLSTLNSEGGQTLIEALAAIAVAAIIVTALVTLGISTQRAANTSRNQNQNTLYGQETLELIRSVRDAKLPGSIRGVTALGCNSTNSCTFTDLFSTNIGNSSLRFKLSAAPVVGGCNGGTTACYQLTVSNPSPDPIGTTIYSRVIKVWDTNTTSHPTDPSNKVKFVEVTITWTDSAGTHESITSTKLTNFK